MTGWKRHVLRIILSVTLMAAGALAAWCQEVAAPGWTLESFRWTGPLAPAIAVEVVNPYGDVRLRAADAGEVELSAMMQRWASDPARAEVKLGRRRSRLTVAVAYPVAPRGDLHRVDLTVFVPPGARVAVRTRDGMIQARGLENDVELASAGGDIFLSTKGTAKISAGRGAIMTLGGGSHDLHFATRHGGVTLLAPSP